MKKGKMLAMAIILASLYTSSSHAGNNSSTIPEFTNSFECGKCHIDVYRNWTVSMHALSLQNPIFRLAYQEAYTKTSGKAKFLCLGCHSPTVSITGDFELVKEISREGVTCDFCHSIKNYIGKKKRYIVEPGPVKKAPVRRSSSVSHKVEFSPLHSSSEICAGCHDGKNLKGLPVRTTYTEWLKSRYSKDGITCQHCHMKRTIVKYRTASDSRSASKAVRSHYFLRTIDDIKKAAIVEIKNIERKDNKMIVSISIANIGAGHFIPTGSPSKKLILRVSAKNQMNYYTIQEKTFGMKVIDEKGIELHTEPEIMLRGSAIKIDERIPPQGKVIELLEFDFPKDQYAVVTAQLIYLYRPLILDETSMRVEIASDQKISPAR